MARILIAGLGSIGTRHLRNLRTLGVGEGDVALLRRQAEPLAEAPEAPVFVDLAAARAFEPDAVLVSTPTAAHMAVALPAVRDHHWHLFVEKPLSHDWDGVPELLEAADRHDRVGLVGYDLRFDPGLLRARELLDQGAIGRVTGVQAQVGQYLPDWRPHEDYRRGMSARRETGGGVLLDLIHELDLVTWLAGPAVRVSCLQARASQLEIETEDTAALLLEFAGGAIGSVQLDYVQRSPSRTCRIIGEEGTIAWDYFEQSLSWYESCTGKWSRFAYAGFDRNDRFLAEMRHFLACLDGREKPRVDLRAGSRSLALALAAKESARRGRVVEVPGDEG